VVNHRVRRMARPGFHLRVRPASFRRHLKKVLSQAVKDIFANSQIIQAPLEGAIKIRICPHRNEKSSALCLMNVRLWLLADIQLLSDLGPLSPRKRTSRWVPLYFCL
jgi:hypothetical protein